MYVSLLFLYLWQTRNELRQRCVFVNYESNVEEQRAKQKGVDLKIKTID
jgi:hypothetical protein